jgi:hypothetical protein
MNENVNFSEKVINTQNLPVTLKIDFIILAKCTFLINRLLINVTSLVKYGISYESKKQIKHCVCLLTI